MPSSEIINRTSAKLKAIADAVLPNFSLLFGTWDDVDRQLDSVTYPAIFEVLSVSGGGVIRNGKVYEREDILLAFVDKVPRDADGVENMNAVERMRQAMIIFVDAFNRSGAFQPLTDFTYTTIYEGGANIHTGVTLEVQVLDLVGDCLSQYDPSIILPAVPNGIDVRTILYKNEAREIYARKEDIPSTDGFATREWVQAQDYLTEETDPSVPAWAKAPNKPSYTAQEVGALPASTQIPSKTSQLQNDSGFLTEHQSLDGYATESWVEGKGYLTHETDPSVPSWAKQPTKPSYTASEVGALPDTTPIPVVPTNVSAFTNDAGYLTSHQSLDGYATEQWVGQQGYLTEHQDISGKLDVDATAKKTATIPYAVVDSTSTAKVFTAHVDGITELVDGTCVMLRNSVVTSASGFTININGLGAHPAFSNMTLATADTTIFNINYTMLFVYCAHVVVGGVTGAWCCYRGYDANTNTIGYQVRGNSGTLPASDTARYYKIYFTSADGKNFVPASVNSTNNATSARPVNQRPIDPFGEIVYTSANTNFTAGTNITASTIWIIYTLTLGYSFNRTGSALTLTSWRPVYVKCAPQADGSAIMDADEPIVQSLPTTEDGKIYIYLGYAYNATSIELRAEHPVYYFKDGAIRLWTNAPASSGGGGGGVLPLAFPIGVNITDSTLIAKWDEMMTEAQTKGNENVSPFSYFLISKQTGMGSWNTLNSGYIQSDYNSIRFTDDWVIEKQNGELTIYYND